MVTGIRTTHAAGGPATVAGVDYEIDCALLDALKLIEQLLADPVTDGTITPQERLGSPETLTGWDYGAAGQIAVESKRNATAKDAEEWFTRAGSAADSVPVSFRLVFGAGTGPWRTVLSRYIALAREAVDDKRLLELAASDGLASLPWMQPLSVDLLRRLELRHSDPAELESLLSTQASLLFTGKPEITIPVLRQQLRTAARDRRTVRASELLAALHAAEVVPREMHATTEVSESDARRVILLLVSRCECAIPIDLLRELLGDGAVALNEALQELSGSAFFLGDGERTAVGRRGPPPPSYAPRNGPAILDRSLELLLAAIDHKRPWAKAAHSLRLAAELCTFADVSPRQIATAFRVLDKPLKDLGDVRLVLKAAQACVAAARKPPGTREAREGEAQALICGVSWAKQRMGLLEEARADAFHSKELGEHLQWHRNTAFCCKCIGRLLRLEAGTKPEEPERAKLLRDSVAHLQEAIRRFGKLEELTDTERDEQSGACHSLLGRTYLECDNRDATTEAIEQARRLIPATSQKDTADLWILRGDFEMRWGSKAHARDAFNVAIESTDDPAFEVAEMRARAFERRSRAHHADKEEEASDLRQAKAIFSRLTDAEGVARTEYALMRLDGRVPEALAAALAKESRLVAVETVRVAEEDRRPRGDALAYRDKIPNTLIERWRGEGRRRAVIQDGGASHVVPYGAPARPGPEQRPKEALAVVCARLVPEARSVDQAARALAAQLLGPSSKLPIRLETIAARLGIQELSATAKGRDGELQGQQGKALRILYSLEYGRQHQRFTIAHELGHAALIVLGETEVEDGKALERFSDTFAGAVLIPDGLLPRLPRIVSVKNLADAARRFDVSVTAMAIRLQRARGGFQAVGVDGDRVVWTAGELRRGRVSALPDTVRDLIIATLEAREVPKDIFLNLGAYSGHWAVSVKQSRGRVMLVLSPSGPVVRPRRYE